jgi:hypothetical protein
MHTYTESEKAKTKSKSHRYYSGRLKHIHTYTHTHTQDLEKQRQNVAHLSKSKDYKHAISYEQGQHAYLSLTADTYSKIPEDFVRFIWMVATSASTNFRPSQLPSTDGPHAQLK